jgi:hypothetical protein
VTAVRVEGFAGIAPRVSARLLPPQGATVTRNAKLTSGELRGLHELKVVKSFTDLTFNVRRAFRIPANIDIPIPIDGFDYWKPFEDADVDFVRSPLTSDAYDRYYWTGDESSTDAYGGVPKMNTRARIVASQAPYRLGLPTPVATPSVTPGGGTTEVRFYVYTFVSAYGEESPPSPPSSGAGAAGSWTISGMDTSVPNSAQRNVTQKKIYRTVPGFTTSEFYEVATIPLGDSSYVDSFANDIVVQNPLLESTSFTEPPEGLQGLIVHPGGFLCGFDGRDLWFSEPFRPHAWPAAYVLTCETEVVGLSIFNNSIIVTTNSRPYIVDGGTPASMSLQKIDSIDPCLSRRSMATTLEGVYYASPQGIVLARPGGVSLVTQRLFSREEWYLRYNPGGVKAVPYGMQYIAFDKSDSGFIFAPAEQLAPLSDVDRFDSVDGIQVDQYSGDVYLLRKNQVALWDPPDTIPYYYTWQSKVFDFPKPVNFGALKLKFRNITTEIDEGQVQQYADFNIARIVKPLNCVNLSAVNAVRVEPITGWQEAQNKTPLAGSPLYKASELLRIVPTVQLRMWARNKDSEMELVYTQTISDEEVYRLPTGFKSDVWQFELVGNTDVYSIAFAETAKELQTV